MTAMRMRFLPCPWISPAHKQHPLNVVIPSRIGVRDDGQAGIQAGTGCRSQIP
ncbi:MAG: hypothetical protein JRF53_14495 [Deltaproteobacteria bacterium]|nr:hypothetical protein [Deltaproteobacteria bacterium]